MLEKLRAILLRKGVAVPVTALAASLSAHGIGHAPEALAATVTHTAVLAAQTAATPGLGGFIMAATNAKVAAIGAFVLVAITVPLAIWQLDVLSTTAPAPTTLPSSAATAAAKAEQSAQNDALGRRAAELFKNFVAEQRALSVAAAAAEGKQMPADYIAFFAAAQMGDARSMREILNNLSNRRPLTLTSLQAAVQTYYAFDMFPAWDEKYALAYSHDILASIPQGSIYYTGVPAGADLVPALQKSLVNGDPCFTLNPWNTVEKDYRAYLRSMWGDKVHIPTDADAEKCVHDFAPKLLRAYRQDELQRDDYQHIGMLFAKLIFDKNPGREFYYEECGPTEWMYPYLEPHGLILKINHQPLPTLSDDIVKKDHDYWLQYLRPMIGDWLTNDTPVKDLVAFTDRVRLEHDLGNFTGDPSFVENTSARRGLDKGEFPLGCDCKEQLYSKLRTAIGGVYAWRADHATDPAEKQCMAREADFAFRQAIALWPSSDESDNPTGRLTILLNKEKRQSDARLLMEMSRQLYARGYR